MILYHSSPRVIQYNKPGVYCDLLFISTLDPKFSFTAREVTSQAQGEMTIDGVTETECDDAGYEDPNSEAFKLMARAVENRVIRAINIYIVSAARPIEKWLSNVRAIKNS